MKNLTILTILFLLFSCGTEMSLVKTKYHGNTYDTPLKKVSFNFYVPKKYKKRNRLFNHALEVYYEYTDSSILFISTDKWSGAHINRKNREKDKVEDKVYFREHVKDSIYMEGIQTNGKYWKEYILNDIIIGYINVPLQRKEFFDKSINSIYKK